MFTQMADFVGKILDKISATSLVATGMLLLTAFVSALVAYLRTTKERSFREFFDFVFPNEIIMHPSAKADLLFWVTRKALMPLLRDLCAGGGRRHGLAVCGLVAAGFGRCVADPFFGITRLP